MSALTTFLSRTHGRGRLSWVDWITYAYLVFGFLLIFLPVSWIALNSVKSSFQLEKQDISLLPSDFERVGRATVYGPDGREKFVIADLPDWVLNWSDLSDEEQSARDVNAYLGTHQGRAFYALRSHLDQVPALTRALIAQRGLPDWLLRYPSMSANARAERDLDAVLRGLNVEEQRLLKEFLGIAPFEPNRFVTQILVSAPDPETGEMVEWAAPKFDPSREIFAARRVDNSTDKVAQVPTKGAVAARSIEPAWGNYIEPPFRAGIWRERRFRGLFHQLGSGHGDRHAPDAVDQFNGGLCLVKIPVQRANAVLCCDPCHTYGAPDNHTGGGVQGDQCDGVVGLYLGGDHPGGRDTGGGVFAAPIHADHSR